jgi:hypothetical protein
MVTTRPETASVPAGAGFRMAVLPEVGARGLSNLGFVATLRGFHAITWGH